MPSICIICRKEAIPGDKSRSFHLFPENSDLKEKWLKAIGRESVGKHSRLCSDHFEPSSFHPKNGYNNIKTKLIKGAIPKTLNAVSENIEICDNDLFINEKVKKINNLSEIDFPIDVQEMDCTIDNNDVLYNDHIYTISDNSRVDSSKKSDTCDSITENNSSNSKKNLTESCNEIFRKHEKSDVTDENNPNTFNSFSLENIDYSINGKHCFKHGNQRYCISRADFNSDEAWYRFIGFSNYKNKQIKSLKQKCRRNEQKILQLKVSKIKDKDPSKD